MYILLVKIEAITHLFLPSIFAQNSCFPWHSDELRHSSFLLGSVWHSLKIQSNSNVKLFTVLYNFSYYYPVHQTARHVTRLLKHFSPFLQNWCNYWAIVTVNIIEAISWPSFVMSVLATMIRSAYFQHGRLTKIVSRTFPFAMIS